MILLCEHCCGEITDFWISPVPETGETAPYWHMYVVECRQAAFADMSDPH